MRRGGRRDITGLAVAPDGGLDRTVFVGFEHGALERIYLPPPTKLGAREIHIDREHRTSYFYHDGELIESLSVSGDLLLSLSSNGTAGLLNLSSSSNADANSNATGYAEPDLIDLGSRGWSTYLSPPSRGSPYAAFGLSSTNPLIIHPILNSTISASPSAILASSPSSSYSYSSPSSSSIDRGGGVWGEGTRPSAVYGICGTPEAFPWGASEKILVSGWYDGFVHVHDLRSDRRSTSSSFPSTTSSSSSSSSSWSCSRDGEHANPTPLLPSLSLSDPWSFEPIYALAAGGGSAAQIAAGSARHSVIAFWDVRYFKAGSSSSTSYTSTLDGFNASGAYASTPASSSYKSAISAGAGAGSEGGCVGEGTTGKNASGHGKNASGPGWSVHAPGNDPSPVYSLILESSRVFGATQSRPFVFDFGTGVGRGTYPDLEDGSGFSTSSGLGLGVGVGGVGGGAGTGTGGGRTGGGGGGGGLLWGRSGGGRRAQGQGSGQERMASEVGYYVTKYSHRTAHVY